MPGSVRKQIPSLFLHFVGGEIPYWAAFPFAPETFKKKGLLQLSINQSGLGLGPPRTEHIQIFFPLCHWGSGAVQSAGLWATFPGLLLRRRKLVSSFCSYFHEILKNHKIFLSSLLGFRFQVKQLFVWGRLVFKWLSCSPTSWLVKLSKSDH